MLVSRLILNLKSASTSSDGHTLPCNRERKWERVLFGDFNRELEKERSTSGSIEMAPISKNKSALLQYSICMFPFERY